MDKLLSCHVLHKENELRVKSSGELFEKRNYLPGLTSLQFYPPQVKVKLCFGILLGTAFVITSVDNATCAGKEDSSASRKDQEDRACATPISSAIQVPVDFRHRAKQERQTKSKWLIET